MILFIANVMIENQELHGILEVSQTVMAVEVGVIIMFLQVILIPTGYVRDL